MVITWLGLSLILLCSVSESMSEFSNYASFRFCFDCLLELISRWLIVQAFIKPQMLHVCSGLRRLPLTPWESNMVNRLQQPTHSYLARSHSAMSLSGEQTGNIHTSYIEDPSRLLWSIVSKRGCIQTHTTGGLTAHSACIHALYILVS